MNYRLMIGAAMSALAIASLAGPVQAQTSPAADAAQPSSDTADQTAAPQEDAAGDQRVPVTNSVSDGSRVTNDGTASDVVVVGIRGSIASAIERKRNNRQIVESVVAEDAGKLPDNNVVDALARISGVNITRSQGQGSGLTIRGLAGVQTTVNGQDVGVGDGRAISLSDVPAELIKSVDVYKSRGATQPEGGIGGTVNVELRRPLELKRGLLVAGSARGLYNDVTDRVDPYVSLLASYRFNTGIGEMGLLVNGSYTRTRYAEALIQSESPSPLNGELSASLPAAVRATAVAPYRIQYGLNSGRRIQPALTATYQWRPSEHLNFILEGQWFGSRSRDRYSGLSLQTRDIFGGAQSITDYVIGPSGALQSATYNRVVRNAAGQQINGVPVNVFGGDASAKSDTIIGNFEAHWTSGIANIDFSAQRQKYTFNRYEVGFGQQYPQASSAVVDFNDDIISGGAPTFSLPGINLADPAQARINNLRDGQNRNTTNKWVFELNTTLNVSTTDFLRQFQFGARYTFSRDFLQYGYRNVRFDDPNVPRPALSALPIPTVIVSPTIQGQTPISFASFDPQYIFDNWQTLRPAIIALNPAGFDGNGDTSSVANFFGPDRPVFDPTQGGVYRERTFAAYGQLAWGLNLGFPVDGLAGLRFVNTWGGTQGSRFVYNDLNPDGSCCRDPYYADASSRANYVDLLPSASAIWHFTGKLQLRTAYNYNVQRPSFYSIRNTYVINGSNPLDNVYAGNPDLKPIRDHNFNASLEWFPRTGTSLSAGAFYKRQQGFIYYTQLLEPVPPLAGAIRRVFRERNAGPGEVLGFEFAGTMPFFFMPRLLQPFGVTANATYIPTSTLSVPDDTGGNFQTVRSPFTSKLSYNLILFYETGKLSGRLAYNWRSRFKTGFDAINPGWVQIGLPQQRLDAAINYTPLPFLTLSVEGTNLLRDIDRFRYDLYPDLSVGLRSMARTVQGSARFRF